jgi:transcriptional regulator with XRE-family HTH domain
VATVLTTTRRVVSPPTVAVSEELGELLRALREARGLTQKQLAESLGIAKSQISQIETAHYTPSLRVLETLLSVLDAHLVIELDEGGMLTDSSRADGPPAQETR